MTHWMNDAACRGIDTVLFFAAYTGDHLREAKRVCAACRVAQQCLDWALDTMTNGNDIDGVYGGTTYTQRKKLRKQRQEAAA